MKQAAFDSDSVVFVEVVVWRLLLHITGLSFNIKTIPEVIFSVSLHPPKSASTEPYNLFRCGYPLFKMVSDPSYVIPLSNIPAIYLNI